MFPLLALCACGGASSTTRDRAPDPGAALEVINRTDTRRAILLDDDSIGAVDAGRRARFRYLRPGPHQASAEAAWPAKAEDITAKLTLPTGKVTVWELPGPRAAPPELADLIVVNQWPQDVDVYLVEGDQRLGGVLTGDTRTFHDLPAGERRVQVVARDGDRVEVSASLDPATPWTWQVEARLGVMQIVNDTDERVAIDVDGVERAVCLARDTLIVERLPAGQHVITARGLISKTARRHDVTIDPERPARWELTADRASLEVVNASGEAMHVTVDGREPVTVETGASQRFDDLASGTVLATAAGVTSGTPHRQSFQVRAGQALTWAVAGVTQTVRVVNGTERRLTVYVGATEHAEVAPGTAQIVSLSGAPPYAVTALSRDGGLWFRKEFDPGDAQATTWRVSTEGGAVHVTNRREEPMEVFIDSKPAGRVPEGEATTFTGVGVGPRLLEAVGYGAALC